MMQHFSRRSFLGMAAITAPAITGIPALQASQRPIDEYDLDSLVGIILDTPRNRCVEVLGEELRRGRSCRDFLAGLFHAAVRHGGDHEVAMMYAASRISGELPVRDNPLPLFWALDSLTRRVEKPPESRSKRVVQFGPLAPAAIPLAGKALQIFHDAMRARDRDTVELAAVSLARSIGSRQTLGLVWRYACRDNDDLGHKAIACANAWRALDAVGWEHAEIPLRYVLFHSSYGQDSTYEGCLERVAATLPKLPPDWCSDESDRQATLDVHEEIRAARTTAATDLVCRQLQSGNVKAGSVWDAIHLSAAELLLRNRKRSRGWPVHAVTSSNALHYAFRTVMDDETRLLLLLQATARLSDQMTRLALQRGDLRDVRIRNLEPVDIPVNSQDTINDIFSLLPPKGPGPMKSDADNRAADEKACRMAFALLSNRRNRIPYIRAACSHMNRKATWNAHDMKFPAAAFEDVGFISEQWRPHFLAATVHAIHGPASEDTLVFAQAREVLDTL